jgi:hypothetical protein
MLRFFDSHRDFHPGKFHIYAAIASTADYSFGQSAFCAVKIEN